MDYYFDGIDDYIEQLEADAKLHREAQQRCQNVLDTYRNRPLPTADPNGHAMACRDLRQMGGVLGCQTEMDVNQGKAEALERAAEMAKALKQVYP